MWKQDKTSSRTQRRPPRRGRRAASRASRGRPGTTGGSTPASLRSWGSGLRTASRRGRCARLRREEAEEREAEERAETTSRAERRSSAKRPASSPLIASGAHPTAYTTKRTMTVRRSMRRSSAMEARHGATGSPALFARATGRTISPARAGRSVEAAKPMAVAELSARADGCPAFFRRRAQRHERKSGVPRRPAAVATASQPTCAEVMARPGREIQRPQEQDQEDGREAERKRDAHSLFRRGHASMVSPPLR